MIKQKSGAIDILPFKRAASTAFSRNDVVTKNSSGFLVRATASTPRAEILGLIDRDVASTDADYAQNTMCQVTLVGGEGKEFECDVDGTLTQAMVGEQFDLTDHNSVDATSNAIGHVECVRYISASKGVFKFVKSAAGSNLILKTYKQSVTLADFTDGGGATGTCDLGVTIPAGAVFVQSFVTDITGAVGDTTATLQIGNTGGDVDRYSTGTPSVSADAASIDMGVPSGTKWHTAAAVPTLLVTEDDDFTDITELAMTVTLAWYEVA